MWPARAIVLAVAMAAAWACATIPRPDDARGVEVETEGSGSFDWRLPPGFPRPRVPAGNPMSAARVELGRHLFYDRRLSGTGDFACATCHRPELAFTDGRPQAAGATGALHRRSAMSLTNVAYNAGFAWADPNLRSLEAQALVPMFNRDPVELDVEGGGEAMIARLAADPGYEAMFAAAFPGAAERIRVPTVVQAIAAFERTLISGRSPYDRRVHSDERDAMPEPARRGMRLFFSERLGCFQCHSGFNFSGPTTFAGAPKPRPELHNTGLYSLGKRGLYPPDNPGLREHTGRRRDDGRFRAPTLRNVALTAPYMHDGSVATLGEVIDHYAAGGRTLTAGPYAGVGRDNPRKSPLVKGFRITDAEKADLIAFLDSLTDPGFVTDPRFSDPFAGDRLAGERLIR